MVDFTVVDSWLFNIINRYHISRPLLNGLFISKGLSTFTKSISQALLKAVGLTVDCSTWPKAFAFCMIWMDPLLQQNPRFASQAACRFAMHSLAWGTLSHRWFAFFQSKTLHLRWVFVDREGTSVHYLRTAALNQKKNTHSCANPHQD